MIENINSLKNFGSKLLFFILNLYFFMEIIKFEKQKKMS
jgi:hypothetical protein